MYACAHNAVKHQLRVTLATAQPTGINVRNMDVERRRRALRLSVVLSEQERKARLAYAISSARQKRGMTPPQLAERLGVGRGAVNKWESGESVPSMLWLGPLCEALGLDANLFAVLPPIPPSPVDEYLTESPEQAAATRAVDAVEGSREPTGGGAAERGVPRERAHE
jgi:transcriptional regulator with XRE-family HTH domain